MSDLIYRQSAVDIVLEYEKRLYESIGTPKDNEGYAFGRGLLLSIERNLKQLPSAERKERWLFNRQYHEADECVCSGCGQLMTTIHGERMNYCPNCGVSMEVTK